MRAVYALATLSNGAVLGYSLASGRWILAGVALLGGISGAVALGPNPKPRVEVEVPDVEYLDGMSVPLLRRDEESTLDLECEVCGHLDHYDAEGAFVYCHVRDCPCVALPDGTYRRRTDA